MLHRLSIANEMAYIAIIIGFIFRLPTTGGLGWIRVWPLIHSGSGTGAAGLVAMCYRPRADLQLRAQNQRRDRSERTTAVCQLAACYGGREESEGLPARQTRPILLPSSSTPPSFSQKSSSLASHLRPLTISLPFLHILSPSMHF